jgi:TldD protein
MNSSHLDIARQRLLAPAGLDEGDLDRVFGQLLGHAVDGGDLYFQSTRFESWVLEDGIVKEGTHSIEQGAGVRAISGDKTGFAYSDEIMMPALLQASTAARAIARQGTAGKLQAWHAGKENLLYPALDPLDRMTADDKVSLLKQLDAEARQQEPRRLALRG